MARLVIDLRQNIEDELAAASEFPQRDEYTFDDQKSLVHDELKGPYLPVQKTIRRTVTCMQYCLSGVFRNKGGKRGDFLGMLENSNRK